MFEMNRAAFIFNSSPLSSVVISSIDFNKGMLSMVGDGYENQEVQEIQYHIVFNHTDFPTACQPYQGHAQKHH